MINIFVVSLAKETKRRAYIQNECAKAGLDATFIDAVDMREATDQQIQQYSDKLMHLKPKKQRWLTRGELGCALSHRLVYQKMVAEHIPYALVLEDDAKIIGDLTHFLDSKTLESIQQQNAFDVLILGYVKVLENHLNEYYRKIPIKLRAKLTLDHQTFIFGTPWRQYACGTVAYIVSLAGAKKLLLDDKPRCTADDWRFFEKNVQLRVLHMRPALVVEELEHLDSTIRLVNYCPPKLRSVMIRRFKGWLKDIAMNKLGMKK